MKYKAGDKVIVRHDLRTDHRYRMEDSKVDDVATPYMVDYAGQIVTILECFAKKYRIVEGSCFWTDGMFEGLARCSPVSCKSLL